MSAGESRQARPTAVQHSYLKRGLEQPGGKLPLFDDKGQRYGERTVRRCIEQGWAEPWFHNPIKPDWLICKLTAAGEAVVAETAPPASGAQATPRMDLGSRCDARWLQHRVRDLVKA